MSADRTLVAHNSQRGKRLEQKRISNTSGSGTPSLLARTERTCTDLSRTETPTNSRRFSQHDTTSEHIHPQHTHHTHHEDLQYPRDDSCIPDDHPACEPPFANPFCTQQASPLHQYMPENNQYEHQQCPEAIPTSPVGISHHGEHTLVTGVSPTTHRRSSRIRKQQSTSPQGKSVGLRGHCSDQYDSGTLIPAGTGNYIQPDTHAMPQDLNAQDTQILYRFPDHGNPDEASQEDGRQPRSPGDGRARANGAQSRKVSGLLAQELCRGHSSSSPTVSGNPGRHNSPAQRAFTQHTVHVDDSDDFAYQQPNNVAEAQDRHSPRLTGEPRASSTRRKASRKHKNSDADPSNTHRARHTHRAARGNANTAPLQRARGTSPLGEGAQLEGLSASPTYSGGVIQQPEEAPYGSPRMYGGTDSPHVYRGRRSRGLKESPTATAVKNAVAEGMEAHHRGGSARPGRHAVTHQAPQELPHDVTGAGLERLSLEDPAPYGNGHTWQQDLMKQRYALGPQETDKRQQWYHTPQEARHTVAIESTHLHAAHEHALPGVHSPMHARQHERAYTTTLGGGGGDAARELGSPHRDFRNREHRHAHTQPLRRMRQPPAAGAQVMSPKGTDQERSHTAPIRRNRKNDQEESLLVVRAAQANAAPAHLPWNTHAELTEGRVHGGQALPLPFRNEAAGGTVTDVESQCAHRERAGHQKVREDSLPRRSSPQERARARERAHTQVQNDREASAGWEPGDRGRSHTEHFQKFQEAPDHARGVSPRRRRASGTPRAGEHHIQHPNLPQRERKQQHQAPHLQQWERQQHQVQEWDQRKWHIQEQQRQLARKNRDGRHAHTLELGHAAINHDNAQQVGARGPSRERKPRGANPVPGVAAQAGHLQPDAVPQQPAAENSGRVLQPLADSDKAFQDIREFLANGPASTDFVDVRDFIKKLGGDVHDHDREDADAENLRCHLGSMDCSHTYDASAGEARDVNVHDFHARRMAPLIETNEDALSAAHASPHQHAQMPIQAAAEQKMAAAKDAAPTRERRNRGVSPRGNDTVHATQYQEERATRRALKRAQTETLRTRARAEESAAPTQYDVQKQLTAAKRRTQRTAQAQDDAVRAREQAEEEAAREDRLAMRQAQIQRSQAVQRAQEKNSNAMPPRWALTEEGTRANGAQTERRKERKSKSKARHTEHVRHRDDEYERERQIGDHSDRLRRNGTHTEVKQSGDSNRHRSTRRSGSIQPSSPSARARQPPLPGGPSPQLGLPERPDSPPPQETRSPRFVPSGASPPPAHQLGASPPRQGSSPQQIPVNDQELWRRMRRSSRALSGTSSDKMGWTVELSGSSNHTGGSPGTGGWLNRELEPEHRRRAHAHTRGIPGSPTGHARNQHISRQPPAQQNSPVLQAALAEYCRGGSGHGTAKPQIIAPGPFGGPASPPDGYEFRTMQALFSTWSDQRGGMQDRMAAASTRESDTNPRARPIPKRRPPGYFEGHHEELYINGEYRGHRL